MSHDTYKIYTEGSNGVSIDDVRIVLGNGSTDIGTLCTSSNINMWAKYKPFRLSKVATGNTSQLLGFLRNANYGLNKPTYSNPRQVIANWDNDLNSWEYLKPRGGANEPYRLGDFRNYCHNAQPPVDSSDCTKVVSTTSNDKVHFAFDINTTGDNYQIGLNDINLVGGDKDWYMGVVATKEGINDYYVSTSSSAITSDGDYGDFEIAASEFAAGNWTFYPVFVDTKMSTLSQGSCNLIPVPFAKIMKCKVLEAAVDMRFGFVTAYWTDTNHSSIVCQAELQNNMTSQLTFTNVKIFVISGDPDNDYQTEVTHELANATVSASGKYEYTDVTINITYSASKEYWVGITFDATPAPNPNWTQIEELAPEE